LPSALAFLTYAFGARPSMSILEKHTKKKQNLPTTQEALFSLITTLVQPLKRVTCMINVIP